MRKLVEPILVRRKNAKIKIRGLYKGYKTRKIFKNKEFQTALKAIRDMEKLLLDFELESISNSFACQIKL